MRRLAQFLFPAPSGKAFPAFAVFLLLQAASIAAGAEALRVEFVYDGDTIRAGGRVIRYIGIDTPEKGEPFYIEARRRNVELLKAGEVVVEVCRDEPKDRYGRTLAWVYSGGVLVNLELLKEGLARALIIPPCGLEKVGGIKRAEGEAKRKRLGIWR